MSRGESMEDTARVLSLYVDFIVARFNRNEDVLTLARLFRQFP